jgi:prepilin-type processing-associated H-X9-DG protein
MCPSDPQTAYTQTFFGWTSYHSNYGSWVMATTPMQWDGVFGPGTVAVSGNITAPIFQPITLVQITDGTSNTAAFAEVCRGPNSNGPPADPRTDCFETAAAVPATSFAAAQAYLDSQSWQTAQFAGGASWGQNPAWRYRGYPWREGSIWRSGYNHLLPPNSPCWRPGPPNDWWQLVSPTSSFHPGGANVVFADGAVHFVTNSVSPTTWVAVGTRAGNEEVDMSTMD